MQGRPFTGTVVGTGAALNVICGFVPRRVELFNITSRDALEWQDTMTAGHALKTVAAGTRTAITTGGISPYTGSLGADGQGFTIGTDAVNTNTNVIHFVAW
jgi:hypothetical protein